MKNMKYLSILGCAAALAGVVSSCASDAPFSTDGEGTVNMRVVLNSDLTRATPDNVDELRAGCVVYISNSKGLLHKYVGADNVPASLGLRYGAYTAEAWAGDSVSASFDSRYYKGIDKFTLDASNQQQQVVLNCRIANVVASVDETTIDESAMLDYAITIGHSRGELTFTKENITAKGYYMMPSTDNTLTYTVTGKNSEGKDFTKTGVIDGSDHTGVKPAHDYRLSFTYTPGEGSDGGSFIEIVIDETEIVSEEIEIYGRPDISGNEFDIEGQLVKPTDGEFGEADVRIAAFDGLKELYLKTDDWAAMNLPGANIEIIGAPESVRTSLEDAGISLVPGNVTGDLYKYFLRFYPKWLNGLPDKDTEYAIAITAVDGKGKQSEAVFRIANTENAIVVADPIIVTPVNPAADYMAVRSTQATLSIDVVEGTTDTPVLQYREQGAADWQEATAASTRAATSKRSFILTGLKPSTTYEYRGVCGEFVSETFTFATESQFVIPNASMEEWSNFNENNKVILPAAGGVRTFWDSGNHGSATMDVNLTQGSSDMVGSGSTAARLRSQFVGVGIIGKFAAGNLFAGEYLETQGTDGRLSFGRPYDGSHPVALKLKANYRPGIADKNGSKGGHLKEGETDQAQIYVALSTQPVEVRTKAATRKLFNPEDPEILAYGQVTWTENFGPDGQLQEVTIPIEYYDRAKTNEAKYLIIVCSASKFGDYFDGGEGSVMYLDDFELVY